MGYRSRRSRKSNLTRYSQTVSGVVTNYAYGTIEEDTYESMLGDFASPKKVRPTFGTFKKNDAGYVGKGVKATYRNRGPSFHSLLYSNVKMHEKSIGFSLRFHAGGVSSGSGTGQMTQFFRQTQSPGVAPPTPSADTTGLLKADRVALQKCLGFLDRPNVSLGEPIAELRSLPGDLKPSLSNLDRFMKAFHRKATAAKSAVASGVQGRYLTGLALKYLFFIAPVIRTMEDVCNEAAGRIKDIDNPVRTARGKAVYTSPIASAQTSGSANGWTFIRQGQRVVRYEIRYGLHYVNTDRATKVPGRLGLTRRDWPATAWELIPFSFLVDRVVNVRRFLKTAGSLSSSNVKIIGGFRTVRRTDTVKHRFAEIKSGIVGAKWTPNQTPWQTTETFDLSRESWKPTFSDASVMFHVDQDAREGFIQSAKALTDVISLAHRHMPLFKAAQQTKTKHRRRK